MTARIGRGATRRATSSTLWRRFAAETSTQGSKAESATAAARTRDPGDTAAAAAAARRRDRRDNRIATPLERAIIMTCARRRSPRRRRRRPGARIDSNGSLHATVFPQRGGGRRGVGGGQDPEPGGGPGSA